VRLSYYLDEYAAKISKKPVMLCQEDETVAEISISGYFYLIL
jgi:hypothetical protein